MWENENDSNVVEKHVGKEKIRITRHRNEMGCGVSENFDFSISKNDYFKSVVFVCDFINYQIKPSTQNYICKCIKKCGGTFLTIKDLQNVAYSSDDIPRDAKNGDKLFYCNYLVMGLPRTVIETSDHRRYGYAHNEEMLLFFRECVDLSRFYKESCKRPLLESVAARYSFNLWFELIFEQKLKLEYLESLN
jgi:hypothetical protein